ncbi:MAG: hypothetical protein COA42_17510 [Alteromonadaceae bacterium]|nr:MAG: hypothetical protein COA42_17510 [Alteromonadaceae bacterium]
MSMCTCAPNSHRPEYRLSFYQNDNEGQSYRMKATTLLGLLGSMGILLTPILTLAQSVDNGQPAENEGAEGQEEVWVTGVRMREEDPQTVPIAINTLAAEMLEIRQARSLTDLEVMVANVNFGLGGRASRGEITIRGIGDYARNIGTNARVAVYLDGILSGRSSSFDQDIVDLERIEILRGPQGTLFGANTIAGAINIITRKPTEDFNVKVSLGAGSFNLRDNRILLNVPLSDNLFLRANYGNTDSEGYIDNIFLDRDLGGVHRESGRLKLRYIGIDNLEVNLGFQSMEELRIGTDAVAQTGGSLGGYLLAPDPRQVAHNEEEFEIRRLYGANLQLNYRFDSDAELVYLTGYRDNTNKEQNEQDYTPFDIASNFLDEESQQLTHELRWVSPKYDRFDYVFGGYWLDRDISTARYAEVGADFPDPVRVNTRGFVPATMKVNTQSLFSHGNYHMNEDLTLSLGARFIHEDKSIIYSSEDTTGFFMNVQDEIRDLSENKFLPKVSLSYQFNDDAMFYASVSRGYKGGGWNADGLRTLDRFEFKSESATSYETGVKSAWMDDALTINLTSFISKFDDYQVFQFVPTEVGSLLQLTNAGKVTSKGLEFDSVYHLTAGLSFNANLAWTDVVFDEFRDGGGEGVDYDGNDVPFAPDWSAVLAVDYHKVFSADFELNSHLSYSASADYFTNPDNLNPDNFVGRRHTVNASVDLGIGERWGVMLWVKNLTDETNLRQRTVSFLLEPRGFYDLPRTFGVTLSYEVD